MLGRDFEWVPSLLFPGLLPKLASNQENVNGEGKLSLLTSWLPFYRKSLH